MRNCPICGEKMRKIWDGFSCDRDKIFAELKNKAEHKNRWDSGIVAWWTKSGLQRLGGRNFETVDELARYWKLKSFE